MPPSLPPRPGSWGSRDAPDPLDHPDRQRRMLALARGMDLYLQIEDLAEAWLARVCGPDLSRHEAILALTVGLRGGLDDPSASPGADS